MTAAKLSWKLGPINASGRNARMRNAAAASSRSEKASRPMTMPNSTINVANMVRTVGTSAPASSV